MKKYLLISLAALFLAGNAFAQLNIVIDGQRDDFYNTLAGPSEGHIVIPIEANANGVVPSSPADISVESWFAWDETYLYYYEERNDDVLAVSNTVNWQNDCTELKIDADPLTPVDAAAEPVDNARLTVFDADFAQEPAGVDNLNLDGNLKIDDVNWVPTTEDYARHYPEDESHAVQIEFRIPWAAIATSGGNTVDVTVGSFFGLAINIADNDGATRESQIFWAAVVSDNIWNTPTMHGTVTFLEGNKLELQAINSRDLTENVNADAWYTPGATSIEPSKLSQVAESYELAQNYPNPFNPSTQIVYSLKNAETVTLAVFNSKGELVNTLISNQQQAQGSYEVTWNGTDFSGNNVASGVYFYQLTSPSFTASKKMVLMK